jgi:hypothetical protein
VPEYVPGIAGAATGVQPVVAPYYQPQQTLQRLVLFSTSRQAI